MTTPSQPSEMRPKRFTLNKPNTHRTVQQTSLEKQIIPLIQFINDNPPIARPELQRSLAIRANTPIRMSSPILDTQESEELSQDGINAGEFDTRLLDTIEVVYDEVESLKQLIKHLSKELAVIRDDIESIKDINDKILQTLMLTG